jgi:tRNA (guanine-N7-)-methyltransferase
VSKPGGLFLSAIRVRQHVNPLSQKYQQPLNLPDWQQIYADPVRSLHLDIGCGRGQFLLEMAQQHPEQNFLGLEIREPLVVQADLNRQASGLTNLHYLFCNVNTALQPLLSSYQQDRLERVTIQFPDPWFKKRHQKRRVVQPIVVDHLAVHLLPGGWVLLQSDIEEVAAEMRDRFLSHPEFRQQGGQPWLAANPFPVPTEREQLVMTQGEPIYRALFVRL